MQPVKDILFKGISQPDFFSFLFIFLYLQYAIKKILPAKR